MDPAVLLKIRCLGAVRLGRIISSCDRGGLPEYVSNQDGKWVAYDGKERKGFLHRARVDIVLITDGKIVDLNRIRLPADTPIIDNRFKDKYNESDTGDGK